jgi:hypothetical protein
MIMPFLKCLHVKLWCILYKQMQGFLHVKVNINKIMNSKSGLFVYAYFCISQDISSQFFGHSDNFESAILGVHELN